MSSEALLSDHDHPLIIETAAALSQGCESDLQRLEALFLFVRDRIRFGFPGTAREWDKVKASHVIQCGYGYCNTKATLLVPLSRLGDTGTSTLRTDQR
jgi:transglutaminase-like putative cysteine protease